MSGRHRPDEEAANRVHFVCARCGGNFIAPDSSTQQSQRKYRAIVRLGGATWCEVCAARRFKRKSNLYAESENAIERKFK